MFRFQQDRLKIKNKLGKGRFGTVFPYQKSPEDLKWVVKRIKAEDADKLVTCLPEIVLGFGCNHPDVVPIKGYSIEKNSDNEGYNIYMKLPRMKGALQCDLIERQKKETPYSEQEIISHFYSLIRGISYLHGKKIYHGDLKPDNLLLDDQGTLKIGDIGIAKHVEEEDSSQTLTNPLGTYHYSAPEILGENSKERKKNMLAKGDIWSLGVVMLELCCLGHRLLNIFLPQDQLQNLIDELFKKLKGKYSASLIVLIQRLLNLDPKQRPDIGEIKIDLEKDFPHILNVELLKLESAQLVRMDEMSEIVTLKQQLQENSKMHEIERKQLKERISKLEFELIQFQEIVMALVNESDSQTREGPFGKEAKNVPLEEKIKEQGEELQRLRIERQKQLEIIAESNKRISSFEEEIWKLQQEKESFWQGNKDIEMTIQTQMKEYENQITALKESHFNKKIKFHQEKKKLLETVETLQLLVIELQSSSAVNQDDYGKDYENNLMKVALKCKTRWNKAFKFEVNDKTLQIDKLNDNIKDASVSELSKDLILILAHNDFLNLFGLKIQLTGCDNLTDTALENIAETISTQALHLKHLALDFSYCKKLTDVSFRSVARAISNQSQSLQSLSLVFRSAIQITDVGIEIVATTIEKSCKKLTELKLDFDNSYIKNQVTSQMRYSLLKRFAGIPKLEIE